MNKSKETGKNVVWSYIGVVFDFGINLFLLPLILAYLPHKELGLWYAFTSVSTLIKLVNFGFTPCVSRYIGFAWGGAKDILANGLTVEGTSHETNYELLTKVVAIAKEIFVFLALIVAVLALLPGSWYIASVREDIELSYALTAWIIYASAISIDMLFGYWDSVLRGTGAVADGQKANMITKCLQLAISAVGLIMGFGLIAVSVSYLIANLVRRFVIITYCKRRFNDHQSVLRGKCDDKQLRRNMMGSSFRFGMATLSAQLIAQVFQIVCTSVYGLDVSAEYGLSVQILSFVVTIAVALFNAVIPEITINKTKGNTDEEKNLLSTGLFAQWVITIVGCLGAILVGPWLLSLLSKDNNLLAKSELYILLAVYFIEYNRMSVCSYISTANELPYTKPVTVASVVTSVMVILEAWLLKMPLVVLLITRLVIELAYNGWYWMRKILVDLKMNLLDMVRLGAVGTKNLVLSVLKRG